MNTKYIVTFALIASLLTVGTAQARSISMPSQGSRAINKTQTEASVIPALPTTQQEFVQALFKCALGRSVSTDDAGFKFWLAKTQVNHATPEQMYQAFYQSTEFQNRNLNTQAFITSMYNCVYFRNPDQGGLNFWVSQMNVNHASQATVLDAFLTYPEFTNIKLQLQSVPSTVPQMDALSNINSDRAFITNLYVCFLGHNPDQAGLNYWVSQFNSGRSQPVQDMYRAFVDSAEFQNRNLGPADFINHMYTCVYFRTSDKVGRQFWVNNMITQNASQDTMLELFLSYPEFQQFLPHLQALVKTSSNSTSCGNFMEDCLPQSPQAVDSLVANKAPVQSTPVSPAQGYCTDYFCGNSMSVPQSRFIPQQGRLVNADAYCTDIFCQ